MKTTSGDLDVRVLEKLDRDLWKAARLLKKKYHAETVFDSRALFDAIVAAASRLAADAGLIRP